MSRNLPPKIDPRGFFSGCKIEQRVDRFGQTYTEVVYCPECRQPVRPFFGVDRCGCQEPHSHLDEMLRRVGR